MCYGLFEDEHHKRYQNRYLTPYTGVTSIPFLCIWSPPGMSRPLFETPRPRVSQFKKVWAVPKAWKSKSSWWLEIVQNFWYWLTVLCFLYQIISVKTYGSFSPLLGTNAFPILSLVLLSLSCRRRLTGSENASPSMILLNFWSKYPVWRADLVLLPPGSICFPLWALTLKSAPEKKKHCACSTSYTMCQNVSGTMFFSDWWNQAKIIID